MPRHITIDPVTRIEGHAKITIQLDDSGSVSDAQFHVTQFRGFEKFCLGRPFSEMPSLTARTCGICPVSHLVASAKACDRLLAVEIPPAAELLRRIVNLAQLVQSHALSFFHLSSPDLLFGMDGEPSKRNIFGLIEAHPTLAADGVALRKFGQELIAILAGKRIHPAWIVPGGVAEPLSGENRDRIVAMLPPALEIAERTLGWFKTVLGRFADEIEHFGNFPSMFMALVAPSSAERPEALLEHYDGRLRFIDSNGKVVVADADPNRYEDFIGESVESFSYLKSPYFKPLGYPEGIYRVGPLARLNIVDRCGTPKADREHAQFRALQEGPVLSCFHQHYARLIEILYGIEKIGDLLGNPAVLDSHVRAYAQPNRFEGIGVAEAPRGTLIHHYKITPEGALAFVNMIIATGHNSMAMNRGVKQVAQRYVKGDRIQEGMLNRVEAVIRTFDPCLSCSTHAWGQMPLRVVLLGPAGDILDEVKRSS
jgi:NAD-reducing hydrogenase large subunit